MVSQHILEIIMKAEDQVSNQAKKANDALGKFGDAAQKANDTVSKASTNSSQKFQQLSGELDKTIENVNKVGNNGSKSFQELSKSQQDAVVKFNMLDEHVQTTLQGIREVGSVDMFPDSDNALSSFSQLNTLTKSWSGSMEYAKTKMELLGNNTNSLKGKIQTTGMAIQTYIGTKWDGIKTKVSSVSQSIKGKIGSAIDSVKAKLGGLTGGFNNLKAGATKAGQGLSFLSGAASMAAGMIGFELFNSFMESGRAAINARSQLDYFAGRLQKMDGQAHLSTEQFNKFKTELGDLQKEFRKVDMTSVGATAEELAVKMNLPADKLGDLTRMTAVLSSTFVKEGRTQEDAVLAVGDALDGQFQKLKEIGIAKDDLVATGKWNGDLKDQKGLIDALNQAMSEMGYEQTAKDITNLDDAFNVLSVSGGNLLAKILIPLTPVIVGVVDAFVTLAGTVESVWNGLPDGGKIAIGFGALAVALGLLVPALSAVEIATLPVIGTLYGLATAELAVSWPVLAIIAAIGLLVAAVYEIGKAFGWWTDVSSMLDAIKNNIGRLWDAFIHHPDVQGIIKSIGDTWKWLNATLKPVVDWLHGIWDEMFPESAKGKVDGTRAIIDAIGVAFQVLSTPVRAAITVLQALYNFVLPIGQGIYEALRPVVCILLGCSPGIVPALQTVQEVFITVWNAIAGFIGGVISSVVLAMQPIINILSQIANFYIYSFVYAWKTIVLVFTTVMASVRQVITIFSMFLSRQISLSTMLNMVWNTISVMFAKVLSIIIGRVRNFALQIISKAIEAGRGFVNGIINFISNLPGNVGSILFNIVERIMSAGASWISAATSQASSMVNSVISNVSQLPDRVGQEFWNIGSRIVSAGSDLVNKAKNIGKNIVDGLLGAMGIHSPGIIQTKVFTEFKNMTNRVEDQIEPAGEVAKQFGETMVNQFGDVSLTPNLGYKDLDMPDMPTMNMDVGMDTSVVESTNTMVANSYDTLATQTAASLQAMVNNDISSYNKIKQNDTKTLQSMVDTDKLAYNKIRQNDSTQLGNISTNLKNKMNTMSNKVKTSMDNMINKNKTGLTSAHKTTTTQLSNITTATVQANQKMIESWDTMKDGIISAADKIKSDSTQHFNQLESTIGSFYRKLQNPSGFGAGPGSGRVSTVKRVGTNNSFKKIANVMRKHALPSYISLGEIRRNPFISMDDIGSYITPNKNNMFSVNDLIKSGNIRIPIGLEDLQNSGAGWDDGVSNHVQKIKDVSNEWDMKGPVIIGKYPTSHGFKVKEFLNGTPKIDFATFKGMAEDVFSQCHYEFYYDSNKYGNWMTAFQHGGMNCSDSSDALIAMAHACGLDAYKVHGHWNQFGHFWANVAGHKMDTTGWMNRRDWTPAASHAGPAPRSARYSFGDFIDELQKSNENETVITNENSGTLETIVGGEVTVKHEFLNLPENISAEEVARLINESADDDSWIKRLVRNVNFQKWDLKEKAKIERRNNRARGV